MANLQVKDFPEEVHDALRRRAREEHVTMSRLVTDLLERELERVCLDDWLKRNRVEAPHIEIDAVALLDAVREEYDPR